jgi:HD domain
VRDRRIPSVACGLPQTSAALASAERVHAGQRRADVPAFSLHPLEVASLLYNVGAPDHVVAAGTSHDVVEDTDVTAEDLRARFGRRITGLVLAVSEDERIDRHLHGPQDRAESRLLDWKHVDLKLGAVELAADEDGRKPGGSWRSVLLVKPVLTLLQRTWIAQGRPSDGKVCPPRHANNSGMLALAGAQRSGHKEWVEAGHKPIDLHEARHTAATWLDHAGVSPKVASQLMGDKTPEYQPGRRIDHIAPLHAHAPWGA